MRKRNQSRQRTAPAPNEPKEAAPPLTGDLALVKEAIDLARKAKTDEATATRNKITDPAAQKLVEWFILRHSETTANFSRYAAFIAANPEWPSAALLRRRAEARLWQERSDAAKVRGFMGEAPTSARGKLALARVKLTEGDRDGAGRLARDAWRSDELSERLEPDVLETVPRPSHPRRPPRAHGQAHRRQGSRRREARRKTPRRRRACDREGLCRGQGQSGQGQGCARRRRGRGARRSRLHALPDPVDARREAHRRRGPPDAGGARRRRWRCRTPINGGASGACSPASCSTKASSRPPTM